MRIEIPVFDGFDELDAIADAERQLGAGGDLRVDAAEPAGDRHVPVGRGALQVVATHPPGERPLPADRELTHPP